ncbi:serine carboxypeptidase [Candidatus Amarolinea dominans]|uniref:serine carboxypeptidase n=1 Tax=Candidatus Amarolinea dominans TaxID=3140696 RepID=UPI001D911FE8|nr:serine carboxypeptidase [Anaerolineae bacterium]
MTKQILSLHLGPVGDTTQEVKLLGQTLSVRRIGADGNQERVADLIREFDGKVDAIALEGMSAKLSLGSASVTHAVGDQLRKSATQTPVLDGNGIRGALERWAVRLVSEAQPGLFSQKNVLMVPGLNHRGLAAALEEKAVEVNYADSIIYFRLPTPLGSYVGLDRGAGPVLAQLKDEPFRRLFPLAGTPGVARTAAPFEHADVLAGDMGAIRRYAPAELKRKIIVVESASDEDIADLRGRGAEMVITTMPWENDDLARLPSPVIEAIFVALRPDPAAPLNEDTYLNLMADLVWTPKILRLKEESAQVNRFAFVIHPLSTRYIYKDKRLRYLRFLPEKLVEHYVAEISPMYLSRITGAVSPATGQRVEGILLTLGATPRELMRRDPSFTYRRLIKAARMSERMGARIMGLGAFTSVVGDAGITVAQKVDIAITSGNSLTVAATLETGKQAVIKMGATDLSQGKAMIVGATGSIGAVCARLLAQAIYNVVLVAPRPERLIALKRQIEAETPQAVVTIATRADEYLGDVDLIVTTTTALKTRIIDITRCKPGAVICDVARPPDISEEEAALRPDVLVIESGEILIPGDVDFGFDIGLPPKTAYACLAETTLLAMEGIFEDYTLGREIEMDRVKEIYRLFKKHGFQLAGMRSFDQYVTDEEIARKRAIADELRRDPARLQRLVADARHSREAVSVADAVKPKGFPASLSPQTVGAAAGALVALVGGLFFSRRKTGR